MADQIETLAARVNTAAQLGMQTAVWAELRPDRVATHDCTGQNRSFGEEARAVVQLRPGIAANDTTRSEILARAASILPMSRPASAAGTILRNRVREPYWAGPARQI